MLPENLLEIISADTVPQPVWHCQTSLSYTSVHTA